MIITYKSPAGPPTGDLAPLPDTLNLPPVQITYALDKALDEFFEETGEKRYSRYEESWKTLIAGLKKLDLSLLIPLEHHSKILTSVIEPKHPKYNFNKMHDYLYSRGFTIYPGKLGEANTFRLAILGAIDKNDIKDFLITLGDYLNEHLT